MHLLGYDKLLVAEREFVRLGCVYKHTSKGLQQKMLFLFNDLLLITSKTSSDGEVSIVISASNEREFSGWWECLSSSIAGAGDVRTDLDTQLNDYEIDAAVGVPAAQVQELSRLAEAVGGVRDVQRERAESRRWYREGVRVQAAVQDPRVLLSRRQPLHVQQMGRLSANTNAEISSQLI
ncbi:unnamed protein product [Leptidea sinapis]|uniref:PH domain-containing protein n=1 Tax=Leptidea sinapis TaxID=189913 RepID=A0A5E4QFM0_9NEOP|nr:unnamed protein product [Leptidea sinapis]